MYHVVGGFRVEGLGYPAKPRSSQSDYIDLHITGAIRQYPSLSPAPHIELLCAYRQGVPEQPKHIGSNYSMTGCLGFGNIHPGTGSICTYVAYAKHKLECHCAVADVGLPL